ncbi:MAG: cytochrome c [Magnetococcales bacterium]|nr:cytochrome c [Magnetococcales bacterium]
MKYRRFTGLAVSVMTLALPLFAGAEQASQGKALHDRHCIDCHAGRFGGDASRIYTRPDHKKKTYHELQAMVAFCNNQVGAQWFDEDVQAVTDFLNDSYYHFPKPDAK